MTIFFDERILLAMMTESILVVDDNQTTRDILRTILLSAGYKAVDTSEDGTAAIDAIKTKRYDTFIVDYRMPSMRGDELTRILRKNQPDAFIIGYSIESKEETFRSAGANAFLVKDDLMQRIVPLIQGRFQIF